MTMPFIASNNHSKSVIVDFDCSYVDVNLNNAKILAHLEETTIAKVNRCVFYIKPFFYLIIFAVLVAIKDLRRKLNSKLFMIYAILQITEQVIRILIYRLALNNFVSNFLMLYTKFSVFLWLAVSSYDYMKTIK